MQMGKDEREVSSQWCAVGVSVFQFSAFVLIW